MERVRETSRRLRDLAEPIAGSIYFVPEAHEAYGALGLDSFAKGYFSSRGACLGHPSGPVVAATFGVFKPEVVYRAVDAAWAVTTPDAVLAARLDAATAGMRRILGEADTARATEILLRTMDPQPEAGRPLFAGLRAQPLPDDPMGALWRACDLVREHRGDGHIAAWVSAGCDPVEIGLLTELFWGLPPASYIFTRGWSQDEVDAGFERLEAKGYVKDKAFTTAGREYRASIEHATDVGETRVVEALGDDADELFSLLEPFTKAVLDAKNYPVDPATTMHGTASQ